MTSKTARPGIAAAALAEGLKAFRAQHRMTQADLAKATGSSQTTISRLESGNLEPTLTQVLVLCSSLKVGLSDLLAGPDAPRVKAILASPSARRSPSQVRAIRTERERRMAEMNAQIMRDREAKAQERREEKKAGKDRRSRGPSTS